MFFSVLGSGSKGNSVYIESNGTRLLIDAGFSGKELQSRMSVIGRNLADIDALCITHEHSDHIRGAGVISRRFKIPMYLNEPTYEASRKIIGKPYQHELFATGDRIEVRGLFVHSFRISHDTADPVGYVVSDGKTSLGYLTDTGKSSHLIEQRLVGCEGLILEFNHNLHMLKNGPYPLPLQQRVRSSRGHLCNEDAAEILYNLLQKKKLKEVVLAHLSEKNNTPELAMSAALNAKEQNDDHHSVPLHIAAQNSALPLLEL